MKTTKSDRWQVAGDRMENAVRSPHASRFTFHASTLNPQPSALNQLRAFTLIELLVVIAIMAPLAALLLPVIRGVKKRQFISHTQAEMAQLEMAIDRYKSAYGFYPPGNPNNPLINQLYYELEGTRLTNGDTYVALDGSAPINTNYVGATFGVGGFINSTKPSGDEESTAARNFLPDLRPKQIFNFTNINTGPDGINVLVGSVGGPDTIYQPLGMQELNPWRYNSSHPTNNPGSYDLWIQLSISGQTNLICNWSKQVQVNNSLH
jgi:prepilin-type N-terminal cleavage/methylation domain-containing protein